MVYLSDKKESVLSRVRFYPPLAPNRARSRIHFSFSGTRHLEKSRVHVQFGGENMKEGT